MLIKAVTKALIFTMQQQPPHMGKIPIPTLIKADMEAAGPYAQRHSFSRWSSNLPHNIRNYIMQETSWMLPSTRDAQAARLPNHPANQPSIIQLECSYMPRAEQSRAKQRTMQAQIANTSHDIDYSIGRSMNRLWLSLRGSRYDQKELEPWTRCYYYHGQLWWVTRSCWLVTCLRFKVSVSSRLAWISHGQETFWTQEELCPPITLIKSIAIGMAWRMYGAYWNNLRPVA